MSLLFHVFSYRRVSRAVQLRPWPSRSCPPRPQVMTKMLSPPQSPPLVLPPPLLSKWEWLKFDPFFLHFPPPRCFSLNLFCLCIFLFLYSPLFLLPFLFCFLQSSHFFLFFPTFSFSLFSFKSFLLFYPLFPTFSFLHSPSFTSHPFPFHLSLLSLPPNPT